ncbi:MAG: hypothetical protein HYU28_01750 [Actinobacteria bacterium]|nr:hypothetical protein [Actinomycetota bacterium]
MRWWVTGVIRRVGNEGALENVRRELEARRFALAQADALARRVASPEFRRRTRVAG